MSSEHLAIQVKGLSKHYPGYKSPAHHLRRIVHDHFRRIVGKPQGSAYAEFRALHDVSLEIRHGETVGVIGRNGSGKSTLLQLVCGTLHPTSGQVAVHGRVAALLELGSGFNPEFTGRENAVLNASVLGLSKHQIAERLPSIAAFADIGDFLDQPVKTYSSGMVLRLAFAVIAHVDADILVIDEALAVGDAFFTQKCMRFLRGFMQRGTVLFVSHDIEAVKALCPRVLWLDKGRIVQDGPAGEVGQAYLHTLLQTAAVAAPLPTGAVAQPALRHAPLHVPRQDVIDTSPQRDEVQVFRFDPDGPAVHSGQATITGVRLEDLQGNQLPWIVGGEMVVLDVEVLCHGALNSPVVGFMVKDRLGQALFGDNTWLSHMDQPRCTAAGQSLRARFRFAMPRLPAGDYSTVVAVSDGTQHAHTHHHWIHDALHFKSLSSSVATGLIGIPMQDIALQIDPTR